MFFASLWENQVFWAQNVGCCRWPGQDEGAGAGGEALAAGTRWRGVTKHSNQHQSGFNAVHKNTVNVKKKKKHT